MAVPKVIGLETEYGITVSGAEDWNPVTASSVLINAYAANQASKRGRIEWDFADESPGTDARHDGVVRNQSPPIVESHLVNTVLTNGARFYVDHAHPEFSTPECRDPLSAVLYDSAGDQVMIDAMAAADASSPDQRSTIIYKDNSDRKGNAYGCHENYLIDRAYPFGKLAQVATIHFITRQLFTGSGKVGSELPNGEQVDYQITQRADHFENEVGLETTLKRPIVNTRDEPHSDADKYRRFHVIVGDANMCQIATFLKVGTSAIVFAMAEDGAFNPDWAIVDPVQALQSVSRDLSLKQPLKLDNGKSATALEVQWDLLELARKWADSADISSVGEKSVEMVLAHWSEVLTLLESDTEKLVGKLDWVTKRYLLDAYSKRHDCEPGDPRLSALDLQYHDLRPGKSLAQKAGLETLFTDEQVRTATAKAPEDTRAYFRGEVVSKFSDSIVAANWDSVVLDTGSNSLQRIPMIEPTRGTKEMIGELLDSCDTAEDLIARLQG